MEYRGHEFEVVGEGTNCYLLAMDGDYENVCSVIDVGHCYLFEHVSCDYSYFIECDKVEDLPLVADIAWSYCDVYMIEEV